MCHIFGLAALVLTVTIIFNSSCEIFHILPANTTTCNCRCEAEPCYTLDQLADEIVRHNSSNLTLYFLPGQHSLNRQLIINSTEYVKLIGNVSDCQVWLHNNELKISNSQNVVIKNMLFMSSKESKEAGYVTIDPCGNLLLKDCTFKKVVITINANSTKMFECFFGNKPAFHNDAVVFLCANYLEIIGCEFIDSENDIVSYAETVMAFVSGVMDISDSVFINNYGLWGGGIRIYSFGSGRIHIIGCEFIGNYAVIYGGAMYITHAASVTIVDSAFTSNKAFNDGGAIHIENVTIINILNSTFINNRAFHSGGAINIIGTQSDKVTVADTTFTSNSALDGGAICTVHNSHVEIIYCTFFENHARSYRSGSAIFLDSLPIPLTCTVIIHDTNFARNYDAAAVTIVESQVRISNVSIIDTHGSRYSLRILHSTLTIEKFLYDQNAGFINIFNSRVDIIGSMTLTGNTAEAINAIQSQIYINSTERIIIRNNTASSGGGIRLSESELIVLSPIIISKNIAQINGGGIYAYHSIIEFTSTSKNGESFNGIIDNFCGQNGGGVYAVASTIKLSRSFVNIVSNTALQNGGGLYLQESSMVYLLKREHEKEEIKVCLNITNNSAKFGGGIYVSDSSAVGGSQCQGEDRNTAPPYCFIQTIQLYQIIFHKPDKTANTFIINNTADSGSALYGGLLDRCTANLYAESFDYKLNGSQYFNKTVMISSDSTISSDPVRVIFCGKNDIATRKGKTFKISVSAINQVGNPVNATIYSSAVTESGVGRLKEGQSEQRVGDQCTELEYNVFSQDNMAKVELYADGPCANLGISKQTFNVTFLPCKCPIGYQISQSEIECRCVCDQELKLHQITNCPHETGTIQLETNIWIGVANYTNGTVAGYIIHDCPSNYCVEKPVDISLESPQERDKQCAFNRSGLLCGECQKGLSLVLATLKCKECSNIYLVLLIAFALAGIALVGLILFFNITVATGTVHSVIFYAHLVPATCFTHSNALTVFISWINLDLGIETCFYDGLSSQAKVLLQLIFPVYLFLLIFITITLCRYSNHFAVLLSNRNPVAALCTLIFLSYSKLIQFIINALQSTVLVYPNGLTQRVWLYDANVNYFTPSHIPQFIAAIVVLIASGLLTIKLFFAQWFLHCSKWKLMKWTRNTKYTGFLDPYLAPFTRKHRYWIGLLLLALIVHNIIVATATDHFLPVLSTGSIAVILIIIKIVNKKVYKSRGKDLLETAFLLNLVFLAYGTQYVQLAEKANMTTTNISMGLSACLFFFIVCYHSYKYVYLPSAFYKKHKTQINKTITMVTVRLRECLRQIPKRLRPTTKCPTNDCVGKFKTSYITMRSSCQRESDLDVLSPITADDYVQPSRPHETHSEVTFTVVDTA